MNLIEFRQYILLDDLEINQDDIEYVKSIKLNKNDFMFSNYDINFEDKRCLSLINNYQKVFDYVKNLNNFKNYEITKYWIQKYCNKDYHDIHTHGTKDNEYSFIIYVDCTSESSQTFFYPLGYPNIHYKDLPLRISPKKGRIVLFNSFLPHGVYSNKDEQRLIISGNITYGV